MKRALARELMEDAVPAVVLQASRQRLRELFPVDFSPVDSFAEAEPSEAALFRLKSGALVAVNFGTITNRITISVPMSGDVRQVIETVLDEVPLRSDEVVWIADVLRGEFKDLIAAS